MRTYLTNHFYFKISIILSIRNISKNNFILTGKSSIYYQNASHYQIIKKPTNSRHFQYESVGFYTINEYLFYRDTLKGNDMFLNRDDPFT